MKFNKVWGNTTPLFNNDSVEVHRIEALKNGYCSKHHHEFKYNMFYVESGALSIEIWKNDSDIMDRTILNKGESTTVNPTENHRFIALEDTVAYEIYWVKIISDDIQRDDFGGIR